MCSDIRRTSDFRKPCLQTLLTVYLQADMSSKRLQVTQKEHLLRLETRQKARSERVRAVIRLLLWVYRLGNLTQEVQEALSITS
mmetsp:Transcript_100441/g.184028  ORF Transcript_100441/g.184028 Transcript_100441/m.184028 type:complete len:84 (-) Transcript_100441:188-439(-)